MDRHSSQPRSQQALRRPCPIVSLLKACAKEKDLQRGSAIHADIIRRGLLEKDIFLGSTLITMYAKCGSLAKAQEVFDKLPVRDLVSWSALLAGYAQHGHGEQALRCCDRMQLEGLFPDAVTYVCILKACGSIGAADKGIELHAKIVVEGLLKKDVVVGTALVDMYAKCGLVETAQEVFDKLPARNVVSWNALMTGYLQHGHGEQVLRCFKSMQCEGPSPNPVTYICILKACASTGAIDKGIEIHTDIIRKGLLNEDIVVGTAVVDMYTKFGLLAKAQEVFDQLPVRNVVSWNALISGYAQHGHGEVALKCFDRMQLDGLSPNAITYICLLKACGIMGAADTGKEIHAAIVREGLLKKDIMAGTASVDMYAKCGLLAKAQDVFNEIPVQNVASWNVLTAGYCLHGETESVFYLFDKMIGEGIKPDSITFTILLNACTHTGLLDKAQMFFETMSTRFGIIPNVEHHSCMVDLFARAGHLDKAMAVMRDMPFSADLRIWLIVLGAASKWGNVKLGRLAFEHAVQLDEKDAAAYIYMSKIYTAAGRHEDADRVEALRVVNHAQSESE